MTPRTALALLVGLSLNACDAQVHVGDPFDGGSAFDASPADSAPDAADAGFSTLGEYYTAFFTHYCEAVHGCCGRGAASIEQCVDGFSIPGEIAEQAVPEEERARMELCLMEIEAMTCSDTNESTSFDELFLSGIVEQRCAPTLPRGQRLCGSSVCNGACVDDACVEAQDGEPCCPAGTATCSSTICDADSYCALLQDDGDGVCHRRTATGTECEHDYECASFFCESGQCAPRSLNAVCARF